MELLAAWPFRLQGVMSFGMEMMLWNIILTAIVAIMGFLIKGKFDEIERLGVLLNKTREEVAREHITRAEVNTLVDKLGDRFDRGIDRLEQKIDEMRKG